MRLDAQHLLQHRRVFACQDAEETRDFMRARDFELDLDRSDVGAFDFVASAVYLPHSYIGYVSYGSSVRVRVPAERQRDDYFIHIPAAGRSEVANRCGVGVCETGRAVVSSPTGHEMRSEAGSGRITISLTKSALLARLAMLTGATPIRPLDFAPTIHLAGATGSSFDRQVGMIASDLADPASPQSPALLDLYEQVIMTGLLLRQPSSYSDVLGRLADSPAEPRAVSRAIDYIQGHLDAPITLDAVVGASGVPGRTLLKHFHDHLGTSPMRYLRQARLDRLRDALLRTDTRGSVTELAMGLGLLHMGRLAQDYRARFGESPSETCRRAGRSRQPTRPR